MIMGTFFDVEETYARLDDRDRLLKGTSNNPFLCGVIRVTVVIWVVSWVSFQKRRC